MMHDLKKEPWPTILFIFLKFNYTIFNTIIHHHLARKVKKNPIATNSKSYSSSPQEENKFFKK